MDLQAYAEVLMKDHAKEIEWLTLFEMADWEITEDEAHTVMELIHSATVTVSW